MSESPKTREERRAVLAGELSRLVTQGRRIETQDELRAVVARGRWIERKELVTVDEWGRASVEQLPTDYTRVLIAAGLGLVVLGLIILAAVTD